MMYNGIRQRRGMVSDDVEALQTDVMRFLAIICMCLMIVFSLVQSLPMSGEENRPKITTREMIQKDIESLRKKADQLIQSLMVLTKTITLKRKEIEQLAARINAQQDRIKQQDAAAQKSFEDMAEARKALSDIDVKMQLAMEKEQQFRAMMEKAEKSLVERRMSLSRIDALVGKGRATLDAMDIDLKEAKQTLNQLDSAQNKLNAHKGSKSSETEKEKPEKKQEPSKAAETTPETKTAQEGTSTKLDDKEGFTLGFDSNEVLFQLLQQGRKVRLHMLSGGKWWQLKVNASGRVSFLSSPSPEKIYEMDRRTVPDKIIRAGKLVVAAFGTEDVSYGVELSSDISTRINRLMKGKKGGDLVILEKGEVSLE